MLKPKKKITKKEMKQDALVTAYSQVTSFYYDYKKYISYAATALAVIILAGVVYINNRRANNEKAAAAFGKIFTVFDQGATDSRQYKIAIDGQPERNLKGLKDIVDEYGGTHAGELARFYLATAYLNLGRYDEALKQFENYGGDTDLLNAAALAGAAKCYESKGDYKTAGARYEKAAGTIASEAVTPEYLTAAARCYGLAGQKERARSLLERLKKEYPASTFAREADRYISEFSA